jgi:hypothetical protein
MYQERPSAGLILQVVRVTIMACADPGSLWSCKEIFVFEDFNPSLTIIGIEIFELRGRKFMSSGADNLYQRGKLGEVL